MMVCAMRPILLRHQAGICGICGGPITGKPSIDHVIPFSRGGFDGPGNVVCACWRCNQRKGNRSPTGCEILWLYAVNLRMGLAT